MMEKLIAMGLELSLIILTSEKMLQIIVSHYLEIIANQLP